MALIRIYIGDSRIRNDGDWCLFKIIIFKTPALAAILSTFKLAVGANSNLKLG
jgi:hypothetical protein